MKGKGCSSRLILIILILFAVGALTSFLGSKVLVFAGIVFAGYILFLIVKKVSGFGSGGGAHLS